MSDYEKQLKTVTELDSYDELIKHNEQLIRENIEMANMIDVLIAEQERPRLVH